MAPPPPGQAREYLEAAKKAALDASEAAAARGRRGGYGVGGHVLAAGGFSVGAFSPNSLSSQPAPLQPASSPGAPHYGPPAASGHNTLSVIPEGGRKAATAAAHGASTSPSRTGQGSPRALRCMAAQDAGKAKGGRGVPAHHREGGVGMSAPHRVITLEGMNPPYELDDESGRGGAAPLAEEGLSLLPSSSSAGLGSGGLLPGSSSPPGLGSLTTLALSASVRQTLHLCDLLERELDDLVHPPPAQQQPAQAVSYIPHRLAATGGSMGSGIPNSIGINKGMTPSTPPGAGRRLVSSGEAGGIRIPCALPHGQPAGAARARPPSASPPSQAPPGLSGSHSSQAWRGRRGQAVPTVNGKPVVVPEPPAPPASLPGPSSDAHLSMFSATTFVGPATSTATPGVALSPGIPACPSPPVPRPAWPEREGEGKLAAERAKAHDVQREPSLTLLPQPPPPPDPLGLPPGPLQPAAPLAVGLQGHQVRGALAPAHPPPRTPDVGDTVERGAELAGVTGATEAPSCGTTEAASSCGAMEEEASCGAACTAPQQELETVMQQIESIKGAIAAGAEPETILPQWHALQQKFSETVAVIKATTARGGPVRRGPAGTPPAGPSACFGSPTHSEPAIERAGGRGMGKEEGGAVPGYHYSNPLFSGDGDSVASGPSSPSVSTTVLASACLPSGLLGGGGGRGAGAPGAPLAAAQLQGVLMTTNPLACPTAT